MAVEFIYDKQAEEAKELLNKIDKELGKGSFSRNGALLRSFYWACVDATDRKMKREALERSLSVMNKRVERVKVLPTPPRPVTRMVPVESIEEFKNTGSI